MKQQVFTYESFTEHLQQHIVNGSVKSFINNTHLINEEILNINNTAEIEIERITHILSIGSTFNEDECLLLILKRMDIEYFKIGFGLKKIPVRMEIEGADHQLSLLSKNSDVLRSHIDRMKTLLEKYPRHEDLYSKLFR